MIQISRIYLVDRDLFDAELAKKADISHTHDKSIISVTIQVSGWDVDNTQDYPAYYDIFASGISSNDIATIVLSPESLATARNCGMCPTNETFTGKIRIRAGSVPDATITAKYWIEHGRE